MKTGGLFTYTHFNNKVVGVVAVSCETDFAEKTDVFKQLGRDLAMQVAVSDAVGVENFLKEEALDSDPSSPVTIQYGLEVVSKLLKEKVEILRIEKIVF